MTLGEYSTYERGNRQAIVMKNEEGFYVNLFEDNKLVETRQVYNHSESYADNLAENWVDQILLTG